MSRTWCTQCDAGWYLAPDGICYQDCLAAGYYRLGNLCVDCCYEADDTGTVLGPDYSDGGLCKPCSTDSNCTACHFTDFAGQLGIEFCDLCDVGFSWVEEDVDSNLPARCTDNDWFNAQLYGTDYSFFNSTITANMGCGYNIAFSAFASQNFSICSDNETPCYWDLSGGFRVAGACGAFCDWCQWDFRAGINAYSCF